jgi:DNA-binding CsgD family transcriptional regulator
LKGLSTAEVARLENNSDKTIRQHSSQVYAKANVSSRSEFFHCVFPW